MVDRLCLQSTGFFFPPTAFSVTHGHLYSAVAGWKVWLCSGKTMDKGKLKSTSSFQLRREGGVATQMARTVSTATTAMARCNGKSDVDVIMQIICPSPPNYHGSYVTLVFFFGTKSKTSQKKKKKQPSEGDRGAATREGNWSGLWISFGTRCALETQKEVV